MNNKSYSLNVNDLGEPMDISLFDTFEEVEVLKEEWDRFMEANGAEIFLSYDWCRLWWKYYGHERNLLIYIFRVGKEIVGILPLMREKIGYSIFSVDIIRFLGTDFTPVTISFPVKSPFINKVVRSLIEELNRKCKWEILHIGPICGCYKHQEELQEAVNQIQDKEYRVKYSTDEVQTYFHIENSWERQIGSMKPRQRTKTRKAYKELQSRGLTPGSTFATKENYEAHFEEFARMHQEHWRNQNMPGHFVDWPQSYDFHKEYAGIAADQDRLRLLEIQLGDLHIGYEYMYKFGDNYYWFLGARSRHTNEIGVEHYTISFGEMVGKGLREKVKTIDAMRGRYEYKLMVGGKLMPVYNGSIQSGESLTRLKVDVFQSLAWALNVLYMKIWRVRLARMLRLNNRPLWNLWIRTSSFSRL